MILNEKAKALRLTRREIATRAGLDRNTVARVLDDSANYTQASKEAVTRVIVEEEALLLARAARAQ